MGRSALPGRAHRGAPGSRRRWIGLGLLTAIGGLVDVGNLVANPQAGARYGTLLVPLVVVSGFFVALFGEMAGRVAAAGGTAGFEIVDAVLPAGLARVALTSSVVVTAMTCMAEVGGISHVIGGASGIPPRLFALPAAAAVALLIWRGSFRGASRLLGLAGLAMFVVVVALVAAHPDWAGLARGLGRAPRGAPDRFAYIAVAQVGSMLVPYQLVFFSSGAREEGWGSRALRAVRRNAWVGYAVGTAFAVCLVLLGAVLYLPRHVEVTRLHQVLVMPRRAGLGRAGEAVMGMAMLAAMAGAVFETALACGYMVAQSRRWPWSMDDSMRHSSRFFAVTIGTLALAGFVGVVGVNVVSLTDLTLVLSCVALPLTYGPVWLAARDPGRVGAHRTGRLADVAGALSLGVVTLVAMAAVPVAVLSG